MAGLTPAQLAKRNNFAIFKRRIKKGEPFTKVGGGKVKLGFADRKLNEEFLKTLTSAPALKNTLPKTATRALAVPVVNGDLIPLKDIFKDKEMGAANTLSAEAEALRKLQELIIAEKEKHGLDTLVVMLNKKKYEFDYALTQKGRPGRIGDAKSDFNLTLNGKPVVFISHKKAGGVRAFSGWGGMTKTAGEYFPKHPEVKRFVHDIREHTDGEMSSGDAIRRRSKSRLLQMRSIYGVDYKTGRPFGADNVTVVVQGDITLSRRADGVYTMGSTEHIHISGKSAGPGKETVGREYVPDLWAIHKPDRNNFGISKARFTMHQREGRRVSEEI